MDTGLDPRSARTPAEFVAIMRRLRHQARLSYRQLEGIAEANGDVLPRATAAAALNRDGLPRGELVAAFARACGGDKATVATWVTARRALAATVGTTSARTGCTPATTAPPPVPPHPTIDLPGADYAVVDPPAVGVGTVLDGSPAAPRPSRTTLSLGSLAVLCSAALGAVLLWRGHGKGGAGSRTWTGSAPV